MYKYITFTLKNWICRHKQVLPQFMLCISYNYLLQMFHKNLEKHIGAEKTILLFQNWLQAIDARIITQFQKSFDIYRVRRISGGALLAPPICYRIAGKPPPSSAKQLQRHLCTVIIQQSILLAICIQSTYFEQIMFLCSKMKNMV